MEKIKDELKTMQSYPRLYLANYFRDLKQKVDLTFNQLDRLDENVKYLEIINKIEQIEQDYYNNSKPFNSFNKEIESLVELDDLKNKIEMEIFQYKNVLL